MPYVGNKSTTFNTFSATDVSVTDDLTVTDDATIGGALSAKGGAVFNEDSADVDFRVEGNGDANLLVCDAGSDFVAIGESSQINSGKLNIATSAASSALSFLTRSTTDAHQCEIIMQKSSTDSGNFAATADGEALGSIKFRGVNTSSVSDIGAEIKVLQNGTASGTVPANIIFDTNESERFRFASAGQLGIAGANYGTSGQVLTSGGASSAPSWADAGGGQHSLIASSTLGSAASSITVTGMTASYELYRIYGFLPSASNSALRMFLTDDSGTADTSSNYDGQINHYSNSFQSKHTYTEQAFGGCVNTGDGFTVKSNSSATGGALIVGRIEIPHTNTTYSTRWQMYMFEGQTEKVSYNSHRTASTDWGGFQVANIDSSGNAVNFDAGAYLQLWAVAKS